MSKQDANRQNNFTAGELSPLMDARTDLGKYHNGCRTLQNCIVLPQGGAFKRPGSEYIAGTPEDGLVRLVPFVSSNTAAYILEFSHGLIRFYQTTVDATTASGYSSGLVLDDDDSTVTSIATQYSSSQLAKLKFDGVGDIMFITHPSHKPRQLIRTDDNSWELANPEFLRGPFLQPNDTTTTISAVGYTVDAVGDGAGGTFRIDGDGDLTAIFAIGSVFTVHGSTNNDDTNFTVASVDWTTPQFTITVSETVGLAGAAKGTIWPDLSRGNNIMLSLSAASGANDFAGFVAGHYGALFELEFLKESVAANGSFTSATTSSTVAVSLGQQIDFSTDGIWTGTITLEVSYDSGTTYEKVYRFSSVDSENRLLEHVEDLDDGLYRLNMNAYTSGSCDYNLTTRQIKVKGVAEITAVVSTTSAQAIIRSGLSRANTPTLLWAEGAWSGFRGYPVGVVLFEQRLFFGGTTYQPENIWGSVSFPGGDYLNFLVGPDDDDSLNFTLSEAAQNPIEWLSTDRRMIIGTSGSELALGATSFTEPLTPTNIGHVEQQSNRGSASIQPQRTSLGHLFVERGSRKLNELVYRWDNDRFITTDMTRLSEHITSGGIDEMALQKRPETILWCVTGDGNLIGLTYLREEEVVCWHRHVFGGSGTVESVAVIPGAEEDEVWVSVAVTINSESKRFVCRLKEWDWGTDDKDAFFVEYGLTYDSTAATTITGLSHLEGETVSVMADGARQSDKTVASGQITISPAASVVHVGLPYTATIKPMKLPQGVLVSGTTKKISHAAINFYETGYAEIGSTASNLEAVIFRNATDSMDTAVPLFTGNKEKRFPGGYEKNGDIIIQSDKPMPMTVLSINLLTEVE